MAARETNVPPVETRHRATYRMYSLLFEDKAILCVCFKAGSACPFSFLFAVVSIFGI